MGNAFTGGTAKDKDVYMFDMWRKKMPPGAEISTTEARDTWASPPAWPQASLRHLVLGDTHMYIHSQVHAESS